MREAICAKLYKVARIGVGMAAVEEIDQLNIYWARMLAMSRAVDALGLEPAMVLVDGNRCPRWERPSVAIVGGDAQCRSIAAASIVAKVTRDGIMADHARDPSRLWLGAEHGLSDARASTGAARARADTAPSPQLRAGAAAHAGTLSASSTLQAKVSAIPSIGLVFRRTPVPSSSPSASAAVAVAPAPKREDHRVGEIGEHDQLPRREATNRSRRNSPIVASRTACR